jgi:hypothetical protein
MLLIIVSLDPGAKFDGSPPNPYEETPNSYYFCCALDDLFWYSYFAFSVYLLRNVRYVSTTKDVCDSDVCSSTHHFLLF